MEKNIALNYIANILTDEKLPETPFYNITSNRSMLVAGIPTLVVGWEKTKEEYPGTSIIEWKIENNLYWTYSKYERRDKYEDNIKRFNDLAVKDTIEKIKYTFFDVILDNGAHLKGFLDFLANTAKKTVYIFKDMIYLYSGVGGDGQERVIGVSLRDCEYIDPGLKKKIFSTIYSNDNITFIKSSDPIFKQLDYKLRCKSYILPFLYGSC